MNKLLSLFMRNLKEDLIDSLDLLSPLPWIAKIAILPVVIPVVLIVATVNTLDDIFLPNHLKQIFGRKVDQEVENTDQSFSVFLREISEWLNLTPKMERNSPQSTEVENISGSPRRMLENLTTEEERAHLLTNTNSSVNAANIHYDLEDYVAELKNSRKEEVIHTVDEKYIADNANKNLNLSDYLTALEENSPSHKPGA